MSDDPTIEPTERTRVRRHPERGAYEREIVYAILDEALICHVAYVGDMGVRMIPTIHARVGDVLYLHGSQASRTMRSLSDGIDVCVAATIVDGLVLARSAFSHSMNYRSVIVYGAARLVTEPEEQLAVARALADHVAPGRSGDARMPNDAELKQTTMLALPIEETSAKVRTGPPSDDPDDLHLPIWAGVLPLGISAGPPEPAEGKPAGMQPPEYVTNYRRPRR
jgi:nitroimidazol reductase NimA-like FMN-containing flavoprotein (pyridoxamine 5'-phosphate oxidase superfamily)